MQTTYTPNTAGHVHYGTGRAAITVAEALGRDDVDLPLYLYDLEADAMGLECWRLIDGVDPLVEGGAFDLWFASGSLPKTVGGDACVYIGKKEAAARAMARKATQTSIEEKGETKESNYA